MKFKNIPKTKRAYTFKMYPSKEQKKSLRRIADLHCNLYNAALQERSDAYKKQQISISYVNQCKSLTEIRSFDEDYKSINAQALQVTLNRLDFAFQSFFKRIKQKAEEPGYPRFKSKDRFPGFGYPQHGTGFKFTHKFNKKKLNGGILKLSGIGNIRIRGSMRTPGIPASCFITRKNDDWYCTLFVHCEPIREHGDKECGLDWGLETYLQLGYDDEENGISFEKYENDRFLKEELENLKEIQRKLSAALRGKRSKAANKKKKLLAKKFRKIANRRKNKLHQVSAQLIKDHRIIYSENLDVVQMTKKASEKLSPLKKKIKTGLNRNILDSAPGSLMQMIKYKAEEAGIEFICLETKKEKPSQHCPDCFKWTGKKELGQRKHQCVCGCNMSRDEASSLYMLRRGRQISNNALGTNADCNMSETQNIKCVSI